MTDDEGAAHAKLLAEYRALEEEYEGEDDFPEEIDVRLGEFEVAMEKLEARPLIFDYEEIARAGAFVTLDRYGELAVYRGFVRPRMSHGQTSTSTAVNRRQGAELSAPSSANGVGHGTVITSAGHAGKNSRRVVSAFIATAFAQPDHVAAKAQWRLVADQMRGKLPKLATLMDTAWPI